MLRRFVLVLGAVAFLGLSACGGDDGKTAGNDTVGADDTTGADDTATGNDTIVDLLVPGNALGACADKDGSACHEFVGANYTEELASGVCDGTDETFQWGAGCSTEGAVGTCLVDVMSDMQLLMFYYAYPEGAKSGCEMAGGTWSNL
jgi:hypothetical protein